MVKNDTLLKDVEPESYTMLFSY